MMKKPTESEASEFDEVLEQTEDEFGDNDASPRKRGSGVSVAVFASLAAITGMIGGAFGTYVWHSIYEVNAASTAVPSQDGQSLASIQKQTNSLQAKLERLDREFTKARESTKTSASSAANLGEHLTPLQNQQAELAKKVSLLEQRPVASGTGQTIDGDVFTRLEKMQLSQNEIQTQIEKLKVQLSGLPSETGLGTASNNLQSGDAALANENANSFQVRLDGIETQLIALDQKAPKAQEELQSLTQRVTSLEGEVRRWEHISTTPLPVFPKKELMTALAEDERQKSGSWVKKTLSKHIIVRDEATLETIDMIESNLKEGNVDAALAAIDRLPASGQIALQAWKAEVRALRPK